MSLTKFQQKIRSLKSTELRKFSENYIELVFDNSAKEKWFHFLNETFGQPIKPAGEIPTEEHLLLTSGFGGIWKDQWLYLTSIDSYKVIAMIWPWQNGINFTFKIFLQAICP